MSLRNLNLSYNLLSDLEEFRNEISGKGIGEESISNKHMEHNEMMEGDWRI